MSMLYIFPVMLAAAFSPRWATILLGAGCALQSEQFSKLPLHSYTGMGVEALALCGCGLFVAEMLHRRRLRSELPGTNAHPSRRGSACLSNG